MILVLLLHVIGVTGKGQDAPMTEVVLVGTAHNSNPLYNGDSLLKAVAFLKPDIILIESDSTSYTFKSGVFKPLPNWSMQLRKAGVRSKLGPEDEMLHKFHREFPEVIIKPVDVAFNGKERDKIRHETLQIEDEFAIAMYDAYERKEMSPYRSKIHLERRRLVAVASLVVDSMLHVFSSDSTTNLIRQLETLEHEHFRALVDSVPSLQRYAKKINEKLQNAALRNQVMVQQILRYVSEYRGKRIVVLTGFLHRYYQLDKLMLQRESHNIRLLDINGLEIIPSSK
jgi:hypothetical protein